MTRKKRLLARIVFVLYLMVVGFLCFGHFSSMPEVSRSYFGIPTDKIVHFLMFLPFPLLSFWAFDKYTETPWASVGWTLLTFIVGGLVAAGTEIGQAFLTDYRSGDPADFRADLVALALGSLLVLFLDIRKQKRHEQ